MFSIEFSNKAKKFLKNLDHHIIKRIVKGIERLKQEPIPSDAKFIGREKEEKIFRYRIGDYRVLYKVKNKEKIVLVAKIDKRPRVYK